MFPESPEPHGPGQLFELSATGPPLVEFDYPLQIPAVRCRHNRKIQDQAGQRRNNQNCQDGHFRELATVNAPENVVYAESQGKEKPLPAHLQGKEQAGRQSAFV